LQTDIQIEMKYRRNEWVSKCMWHTKIETGGNTCLPDLPRAIILKQ
jgi:hypothetical protein